MKTLILDFDGTLADTQQSIVETMRASLIELGLPPVEPEEITRLIGLPLRETYERITSLRTPEELDRAVKTYQRLFNGICFKIVRLFPSVKDTLAEFYARGVVIAVASSRGHKSLEELSELLGIRGYISEIVGVEDVEAAKPAPDMVLKILAATHTAPEDALVVGDTEYDILMGSRAGCRTCGVTYGNHSRARLAEAGATWIIDGFGDLLRLSGC